MSIASVHKALSARRAAIIQDLLVALPAEVAFSRSVPAAALAPPLGQLMDCVLQAVVELRREDVRGMAMEVCGARRLCAPLSPP